MSQTPPERKRVVSRKEPLPARMGSYQILTRLAEGGMGTVYFGRHAVLGGMAAIKVLKAERRDSAAIVARFQKEAQALARVDHENVVQVLDVGEEDGLVFIAMELAQGMDLRRWIKRDGKLPPEIFRFVAQQIISGIAAAHAAGVLHRDIKPDNVIVNQHGAVKISDFGLADDARLLAGGTERQTFATIAYAAPEVLSGQRSDARSDVYSLAATLWHVATGELPFGKESRAAVMARQSEPLKNIRELIPELPAALAKAIMLGLRQQAAERPSDAMAFYDIAFPTKRAGFDWPVLAAAASLMAVLVLGAMLVFGGSDARERDQRGPPAPLAGKSQADASADQKPSSSGVAIAAPLPKDLTVAPVRERRAAREWEQLTKVLADLNNDAPRQLGLLFDFMAQHRATAPAQAAESRYEGIAARFERERREAFGALKESLGPLLPSAQLDALEAFPPQYLEVVDGLDQSLRDEMKALRGEAEKRLGNDLEALTDHVRRVQKASGADAALAAMEHLAWPPRMDGERANALASYRAELERAAARDHQAALLADDEYLAALAAGHSAIAQRLAERARASTLAVWRAGPKTTDGEEWQALHDLGGPLAASVDTALTGDLARRAAAYAWLRSALNAKAGTTLDLPKDADLAPAFGLPLESERLTIVEAKEFTVALHDAASDTTRHTNLRALDLESWRRLSEKDKTFEPAFLATRIEQIADPERRLAWQRELALTPDQSQAMPQTFAALQVLLDSQANAQGPWRGYLADHAQAPDAALDIRRAVLDATSGVLDQGELLRAWRLAPESYRVARALARLALAERIPAAHQKEIAATLAIAAKRWQDRALKAWAEKNEG